MTRHRDARSQAKLNIVISVLLNIVYEQWRQLAVGIKASVAFDLPRAQVKLIYIEGLVISVCSVIHPLLIMEFKAVEISDY